VNAYTHYAASATVGPSLNNAFFSVANLDDGGPAQMAMFVGYSTAAGYFTDSALDANVIIHEYTHGVSLRLVRLGYSTFQGASMGEAWSDFFGLEYLVPAGAPPDGVYPAGEYFFALFGPGLRTHPFSTRTDVNPLTYADLGAVNANGPEVHADGEIWVEALLDARANLIQQFGETEGRRRIRLLVLDGMKLSVPAPSMVDMRDAILLADRVDFKGESQGQLWAAFAKRGLGALAYATSGDSVHVVPSFDLPSPTGKLKFFDDPLVGGETVRVLLADSNNNQPVVRIQLTGSAGDLEDLLLHRVGSVYFGSIPSSRNVVNKQNGTLNLIPGDAASAYYVDYDPGGEPAKLIQTTVNSRPPYAIFATAPSFSFTNETRITNVRAPVTLTLPFEFPFFSKKYRSMTIYPTGVLGFGFSAFTSLFRGGCNDITELARFPAVAPLFANLNFGAAQPNEGIFVSFLGRSVTIRWAAETVTPFGAGDPVNFAVTLTDDGVIQYFYGSGNASFNNLVLGSTCGQSPVIGISNGHEAFTQSVLLSNLTNGVSLRFDPPFNFSSVPVAIVERPSRGETVRGVLTVSGIAYDPDATVSRVDVFIDGVQRVVAGVNVSRPDFCAQQNVRGCPIVGFQSNLDVTALGLAPGAHNLYIRVSNTRGSFTDAPATPVSFTVDAGPGRLPKGAIEFPASGATLSGPVQFRGYAYFDDLRVSRVDLLIDGLTYPGASYGLARTDICNPLPTPKPPNCNNVGWTVTFDTRIGVPPLPDGPHGAQLRVLDESGRFTLLPDSPLPFTVNNGAQTFPVGALTSHKPNDRLSGIITVSGYAYSLVGQVTSVTILVDGRALATTRYGDPRPVECATLTGVTACPNIGYTGLLDTRTIPNGPHVLGVLIRNDQGLTIITPQLDRNGMNVLVDNP
jgi:hypothetical protein